MFHTVHLQFETFKYWLSGVQCAKICFPTKHETLTIIKQNSLTTHTKSFETVNKVSFLKESLAQSIIFNTIILVK